MNTNDIDLRNQQSAKHNLEMASGLNYEWYLYSNSNLITTRPFCMAMAYKKYFHLCEIPFLLKGTGLRYINKKGKKAKIPIYKKTGFPRGMIPGTNSENFLINRGGYRCGHQCRPVNAGMVTREIKERVFATEVYLEWKKHKKE